MGTITRDIYRQVLDQALASPTAQRLPDSIEEPECPRCKGARYVVGKWSKPEAEMAKATTRGTSLERMLKPCPVCTTPSHEEIVRAANLFPIKQQGERVEGYPECLARAVLACDALLAGERWLVFLRGSVGVGKTHLANTTGLEWVEAGKRCLFVVAGDLLDRLRATQAPEAPENLIAVLELYAQIPLLILDDLGAERPKDFGIEQLFKIIDRRGRSEKATIVTSNVQRSDDDARIGRRVASRLAVGEIVVSGPDRRRARL